MLVYPKPRLPITGAGMSQTGSSPASPAPVAPAPTGGPPSASPGATGMQLNQTGAPRSNPQANPNANTQQAPKVQNPLQGAQDTGAQNPLLGRAAMSANANYGSGSGQWGREVDRHPGGYAGAGSGAWEQSYHQQNATQEFKNKYGVDPKDIQEGKPGANVAAGAINNISQNMAQAERLALAPGVAPGSNLRGGSNVVNGGAGPGSLNPPAGTRTHDTAPINYPSGQDGTQSGTATSTQGLSANELPPAEGPPPSQVPNDQRDPTLQDPVADPQTGRKGYPTNTKRLHSTGHQTEDGRTLFTDGDAEYVLNAAGDGYSEYTNVPGYNPDTGVPYNQTLMDAWASSPDNKGGPIQPHNKVHVKNSRAPGGEETYEYTPDANGNPGWTAVDQDGRPLNGPQGTPATPQGGQGGTRPATGYPEGYTTDGYAVYDQNGMRLSDDEREAAKGQVKMGEMLKGIDEGVPEMSREGLDAQTKANDESFAAKSADAMRAALVASARGGASPEFQSGQIADVAQRGGLAGAQANAQAKLQYDVQNFQAQIHGYDAKLQALEQAAQFAHDDASQQRIIQLQKQLMSMKNDAEMKLAKYQAELNKPGVGDYILGGLGALAGAIF